MRITWKGTKEEAKDKETNSHTGIIKILQFKSENHSQIFYRSED